MVILILIVRKLSPVSTINRALPFRVFQNGKDHIEDVLLLDNGLYVFKMRSEEACLAILGKGTSHG